MQAICVYNIVYHIGYCDVREKGVTMPEITTAPQLTSIESEIIEHLVTNPSSSSVASTLGIPVKSVAELRRKKGVKEWIAELKIARRDQMLTFATETLAATLQSKVDAINADDEKTLGNSTRKDHVEVAKTLIDSLKGTATDEALVNDPMAQIYSKLGAINAQNVQIVNNA